MSLATKTYLKWLWLEKSYHFRWAHKPLCNHFKKDIILLGNMYLCRSCVFTYFGIFVGTGFTIFSKISSYNISIFLVALLLIILPLSHPVIYKKTPRLLKDMLRLNLGIMISFSILLLLYYQKITLPLVIIGISIPFCKAYYQKRSTRKIKFCEECSEYQTESICSGYYMQANLIREYEDKATEFLYGNAYIPQVLQEKQQK